MHKASPHHLYQRLALIANLSTLAQEETNIPYHCALHPCGPSMPPGDTHTHQVGVREDRSSRQCPPPWSHLPPRGPRCVSPCRVDAYGEGDARREQKRRGKKANSIESMRAWLEFWFFQKRKLPIEDNGYVKNVLYIASATRFW